MKVTSGALAGGLEVQVNSYAAERAATRRNHTATHLLHAALKSVLGPHVKQAGSLVAPDRLRFDFTHYRPLTPARIREIEDLVNARIVGNQTVETRIMPLDKALETGAVALFGEKYAADVRVVDVPDFSTELCGGLHCAATGDIGVFKILAEKGISAGVRRLDALSPHFTHLGRDARHRKDAGGTGGNRHVDSRCRSVRVGQHSAALWKAGLNGVALGHLAATASEQAANVL